MRCMDECIDLCVHVSVELEWLAKSTHTYRGGELTEGGFQGMTCPGTPAHRVKVRQVRVHPEVKLLMPAVKTDLSNTERARESKRERQQH